MTTPSDTALESCVNCYHFHQSPSGRHGYCKRFPPVFTGMDAEGRFPKFFNPVVSPDGICGEWEEAEIEVSGHA